MRNKKSYMNKENILKEGFFDKLKKMLGLSTKQQKILKTSKEVSKIKAAYDQEFKEVSKIMKGLNNQVDSLEKVMNQEIERLGIDSEIKLNHYTLKDFDK